MIAAKQGSAVVLYFDCRLRLLYQLFYARKSASLERLHFYDGALNARDINFILFQKMKQLLPLNDLSLK